MRLYDVVDTCIDMSDSALLAGSYQTIVACVTDTLQSILAVIV